MILARVVAGRSIKNATELDARGERFSETFSDFSLNALPHVLIWRLVFYEVYLGIA